MSDLPWPKKGNKALGNKKEDWVSDPTVVSVHWLLDFNYNYHADAFQAAGDLLIVALKEGHQSFGYDKFIFPVAYLYRHAIELQLKDCITAALRLRLLTKSDSLDKLMTDHNLYKLWKALQPAILEFFSDAEKDPVIAAEATIAEFHKLDKTGQGLRYKHNIHGKVAISRDNTPDLIDLEQMKQEVAGLINFLNGCDIEFSERCQMMCDMERDYYQY